MALAVPERFAWVQILKGALKEIERRTAGEVAFSVYAGGVMGDEEEIAEKLRTGEVQSAAVTMLGLKNLIPELAAFALPSLVGSSEEVRKIREILRPDLERVARARGFELVAWVDVGFTRIFSRYPLRDVSSFSKLRTWVPEGSLIDEEFIRTLGGLPVSATMGDVKGLLEKGKLDIVYNAPLGCALFGWHEHLGYVMDLPAGYAFAFVIARVKEFDATSARTREVIKTVARGHESLINDKIEKDNTAALIALQKRGLQLTGVSPAVLEHWRKQTEALKERVTRDPLAAEWHAKMLGALGR